MNFLDRFLTLIKENNTTVSDISQQTGLPRSTISSYINRKSTPSAFQLEILANFFDVSIDYLVGREDDFGNKLSFKDSLTPNEQDLLKFYRGMNDVCKNAILTTARNFYNLPKEKTADTV